MVSLEVSFSPLPGSSLSAVRVHCSQDKRSPWIGDTTNLINETQSLLSDLDQVNSITVEYGDLVDRLGRTLDPASPAPDVRVVGANSTAPSLQLTGLLDCLDAPIIGFGIAYGDAIDSISLRCGIGSYFTGQLFSAVLFFCKQL